MKWWFISKTYLSPFLLLLSRTHVKIIEDGKYPVKKLELETPASLAIKNYIETAISKLKKKDQLLYVNIKQLRFENVNLMLFFSAEAYFQINDRFWKVAAIRKSYSAASDIYPYGSDVRTLTRALNDLIKEVDTNYYKHNYSEIDSDTVTSINSTVTADWAAYPVANQSLFTNGVYKTFEDFRNNTIQPIKVALREVADSIYSINYADIDSYYRSWEGGYNHIFALCFNGDIYFLINDRWFLRCFKMNNTFYFRIPQYLSNIYSIFSESFIHTPYVKDDYSFQKGPLLLAVAGLVVGNIEQHKVDIKTDENRESILKQGLNSGDMRSCFLDMDTGDIVYY